MTVLDLFLKHNIIKSTDDVKSPEKLHSKISQQWGGGFKEDCQEFVDIKKIDQELTKNTNNDMYVSRIALLCSWIFLGIDFFWPSWFLLLMGGVLSVGSLMFCFKYYSKDKNNDKRLKKTISEKLIHKMYKEQFSLLSLENLEKIKSKNWLKQNPKWSKWLKKNIRVHQAEHIQIAMEGDELNQAARARAQGASL